MRPASSSSANVVLVARHRPRRLPVVYSLLAVMAVLAAAVSGLSLRSSTAGPPATVWAHLSTKTTALDGMRLTDPVVVSASVKNPRSFTAVFYLDGAEVSRDGEAPYEMFTDSNGQVQPLDPASLSDGEHRVDVDFLWKDSTAASTSATFVVESGEATEEPTEEPTAESTEEPTAEPTEEPTTEPTEEATEDPTNKSSSGGTLYETPSSIATDCSVDVTGGLNDWIDSVPDGTATDPSVLSFPVNACYRIEDKLVVTDRHHLVFDGNGSTFKATTAGHSDRKQWQVYAGSDITFTDMTVIGANLEVADSAYTYQEWQHNFDFWGTQGAVIDGVTGKYAFGDFVGVEPDYRDCCGPADFAPPRNIVIRNSSFHGAGRMGISTNYVEGLLIENNTIDRVRWSTIDIEIEDTAWHGRDITIRNNTIGDVWHAFVMNSGYDAPTENVVVTGNVMTKLPGTNIPNLQINGATRPRSHWTIENNTLLTREFNVWTDNAPYLTVRNNDLRSWNADQVAVHAENSDNGTVTGNVLTGLRDGAGYKAAAEYGTGKGWTVCGNTLMETANSPTAC